ncbi:MAG: lysophospholipase [Candidatus Omnitrophica bacterium]|nr:lysophospholipase [Candidatus Omnitrophota bacterium]MBU1784646.1 lysophospholipase [Candidatus Omnitrophota bacterium]
MDIPAVKTDQTTGIMYRVWEAGPGSSETVLLLVHGLGAYGGRWAYMANFLSGNNISSYAIELRGFGETKSLKGHVESFNVYFKDIHRLNDIIRAEHPGKEVVLLGSSMGGLISFLIAALFPEMFDGLICISPAFTSNLKFKATDYIEIFFEALFKPKRQFRMPFKSRMCTRDEECVRDLDNDHREHRLATSRLLFDIAIAQVQAQFFKGWIRTRTLFLLAEHDELVIPGSSKKIFRKLKTRNKTMISYQGMYHGLEIDRGKEKVFSDILYWIRNGRGRSR